LPGANLNAAKRRPEGRSTGMYGVISPGAPYLRARASGPFFAPGEMRTPDEIINSSTSRRSRPNAGAKRRRPRRAE